MFLCNFGVKCCLLGASLPILCYGKQDAVLSCQVFKLFETDDSGNMDVTEMAGAP